MKYYGTANHLMYVDLSSGIRPGGSLCMLWFGYWRVAPFGTRQLRVHANTLCYDDDHGCAVQYVCFAKGKCFVRFSVSLTEPVAHKKIYIVL